MNTTQQHLLDAYRATQRHEATPPAPGTHTVRTVREIQQWRRFRAVLLGAEGRGPGRIRRAVGAAVRAFPHPRVSDRPPASTPVGGRSPEPSTRGGGDLVRVQCPGTGTGTALKY